jgi:NADPH:quinone reductase-like Zn-dependent oxidoreductase
LQILQHWGYTNLFATASPKHHELLVSYGAVQCFDYKDAKVVEKVLAATKGAVPFVLDCIGSQNGSVIPISKIARKGAKVAILLPVIVRDASETEAPIYEMDVSVSAEWAEGVDARGVRTHFYLEVRNMFPLLRAGDNETSIDIEDRMRFSEIICNPLSCRLFWPRGMSSQISIG